MYRVFGMEGQVMLGKKKRYKSIMFGLAALAKLGEADLLKNRRFFEFDIFLLAPFYFG